MNKKELAIMAGLTALSGCSASDYQKREAMDTMRDFSRGSGKMVTGLREAAHKGLLPPAEAPVKDWPSTMQKSKSRSR